MLRQKAGLPSRVRRGHPLLLPPHGEGDDGQQPPAGVPAGGLPDPGQRLGHRPRLRLRVGRHLCGHAPRPAQGVPAHVPGAGRALAGPSQRGRDPLPHPAGVRPGGVGGGEPPPGPDERVDQPHPGPLRQGGGGGAADHRQGGQPPGGGRPHRPGGAGGPRPAGGAGVRRGRVRPGAGGTGGGAGQGPNPGHGGELHRGSDRQAAHRRARVRLRLPGRRGELPLRGEGGAAGSVPGPAGREGRGVRPGGGADGPGGQEGVGL